MTITPIQNQKVWDEFLLRQKPNTFLQSWEWGQVQIKEGEHVSYLGLYENEVQVGAMLVITVNAKRGKFLLVPHGPIMASHVDVASWLPIITEYLKSQAKKEKAVAVRVAPLVTSTSAHAVLFKQQGYVPAPLHIHAELTWVLDIAKSEEVLLSEMRKTTRHAIKKAEEVGVQVEIISDSAALKRFWPLYQSTTVRHKFAPFKKEFIQHQLEEFLRTNRLFVSIATHQGRDVAGAIFMQYGDTVFYYHGASKKLPSTIPAAQLVQFRSIQEAKKRGASRYNFWGIAPEDEPKHPFAGITVFKKGFGGYAIDYMHAQDLPTSIWYWKLWLVEMYRKYKRGF